MSDTSHTHRSHPGQNASSPENTAHQKSEHAEKAALGNQTDLGDQTELNVTGDQPTGEPLVDQDAGSESLSHSNSTADSTNRSPYGSKAGIVDAAGMAGAGKDKDARGPTNPSRSHHPAHDHSSNS